MIGRPAAAWMAGLALAMAMGCLTERSGGGSGVGVDGAGGQAGAEAGSGGRDATDTAPAGPTCRCAEAVMAELEACEFARVECEYDPYCRDWLDCFAACAAEDWSATCLAGCEASHPAAAGIAHSIVRCACAACVTEPTCAGACS